MSELTKKQKEEQISSQEKWMIALLLGLIFFIVSHHIIYKLGNIAFNYIGLKTIADSTKQPNGFGYAIHILVFILIVRILMK